MLKGLAIAAVIAAAICVPTVVLMHHSLMPNAVELAQLDAAAQAAAPPGSVVHRLRAPDRIEMHGDIKTGYFTYEVRSKTSFERYLADWRIENGRIELVSFKRL